MAITEVLTNYGKVRGTIAENGKCSVFKGIPYAKPPVGKLRFRPAQKMDAWDGVKDCTAFKPAPMQELTAGKDYEVSEDCLYLNIWTGAESEKEKLPVMFWIYGGGFTWGASHEAVYDGQAIADMGCILVSINYRVNIFGFFNTPELEKENGGARCAGILDQIAALDWVRENISYFGGDPDNILIFGQSAGGISTRMLLTSPLTEGKMARAIVHSGGGLNEADIVRGSEEFKQMCVKTLEYAGWTFDDIMQKDADEVLRVMQKGVREMMADGDLHYFQPFIDGYALLDVPGKMIARGEYHDIDIMCGTVAGDAWMFSRKVKDEIVGNTDYFKGFALSPSIAWGRNNIRSGRSPIYSYYMDRTQPKGLPKYYTHGTPPFGAATPHGAELAYLFGTLAQKDERFTQADYELADILRKYWTDFAKSGDPNGKGLTFWPKFAKGSEITLHISDDGIRCDDMVSNEDIEKVVEYTVKNPGMLCKLVDF